MESKENWATAEMGNWLQNDESFYGRVMAHPKGSVARAAEIIEIMNEMMLNPPDGFRMTTAEYAAIDVSELLALFPEKE